MESTSGAIMVPGHARRRKTSMEREPRDSLTEQYQAYISDLGNIGARHSQTNTLYMSIITALLIFISLAGPNEALEGFRSVTLLSISLLGIFVCAARFLHVRSYGFLFKAKFDVLKEMEKGLPFHCYERELELLNPRFFRFSSIEQWLSALLSLPFVIIMVYALATLG